MKLEFLTVETTGFTPMKPKFHAVKQKVRCGETSGNKSAKDRLPHFSYL